MIGSFQTLPFPTLWVLTIGVAIAFLFDFILKLLRMQIVDETGRRVDMAVAGRLFDHFLRIKMVGRPASTGAVANQVRDLDSVRDALTSSTVIAATDFLFIGIFVWVMWFLVGPLAWVPLVAVPVVIAVTCLVQVPLTRALSESQKDSARRQSVLVETISSLETIKVSGGESWFRKAWDRAVAAASRSTAKARYWGESRIVIHRRCLPVCFDSDCCLGRISGSGRADHGWRIDRRKYPVRA